MGIYRPSNRTLIGRPFFEQDPLTCARELIGARLQWGVHAGIVVETEAYDAEDDPACHTFFRPLARHFVENHPAGAAYVYLNYGMHWMLNALVKGTRSGFVLIRAIEPLRGVDAMMRRRGLERLTDLCSGPGKLTQAFGIDGGHHGVDLCRTARQGFHREKELPIIASSPRIGISKAVDLPWRFFAVGNPHVSSKRFHSRVVKRKRPDGR
ncbi:MAG: DNA-3-methyladenine glycosylase [Terrimicrobiaceae bacterium]|nr:DNA-3-methyladenine glycosylase [Terrimicrobiaceae bacterium]